LHNCPHAQAIENQGTGIQPTSLCGMKKADLREPCMSQEKIRVGVVERCLLFQEFLGDIINSQKDMVLAFSSSSLDHQQDQADVILLQEEIIGSFQYNEQKEAEENPKYILINVDRQQGGFVHHLIPGVRGLILSTSTREEILRAIRAVAEKGWAIPDEVAVKLWSEVAKWTVKRSGFSILADARITNREREIIQLIKDGLTNKEIASRLNISPETVKSHVHRIMEKRNVRKRADLTCF
jgi:two-component system, NarL family, nitrate/nitrite response regulator NarL